MNSLLLYCDGSTRSNSNGTGPSGFSVIITNANGTAVIDKIISPLFLRDKSDRMELLAVREAFKWLKNHNFTSAVIFSDNQAVVDGYNKKMNNWISNGFLGIKYVELWKDIAELKQKMGDRVYVEKVKAHQKREGSWNNEADKLAKIASNPNNPNKMKERNSSYY